MPRILTILTLLTLAFPAGVLADNISVSGDILCPGDAGFPDLAEKPFWIVDDAIDPQAEALRLPTNVLDAGQDEATSETRLGDLEVKVDGSKAALFLPVGGEGLSPFLDAGVGEGRAPLAKSEGEMAVAAAGFQTYRLGGGVGCTLDSRTKLDLGYHYAAEAGEPETWDALARDPEPEGEGHNISLDFKVSF